MLSPEGQLAERPNLSRSSPLEVDIPLPLTRPDVAALPRHEEEVSQGQEGDLDEDGAIGEEDDDDDESNSDDEEDGQPQRSAKTKEQRAAAKGGKAGNQGRFTGAQAHPLVDV